MAISSGYELIHTDVIHWTECASVIFIESFSVVIYQHLLLWCMGHFIQISGCLLTLTKLLEQYFKLVMHHPGFWKLKGEKTWWRCSSPTSLTSVPQDTSQNKQILDIMKSPFVIITDLSALNFVLVLFYLSLLFSGEEIGKNASNHIINFCTVPNGWITWHWQNMASWITTPMTSFGKYHFYPWHFTTRQAVYKCEPCLCLVCYFC